MYRLIVRSPAVFDAVVFGEKVDEEGKLERPGFMYTTLQALMSAVPDVVESLGLAGQPFEVCARPMEYGENGQATVHACFFASSPEGHTLHHTLNYAIDAMHLDGRCVCTDDIWCVYCRSHCHACGRARGTISIGTDLTRYCNPRCPESLVLPEPGGLACGDEQIVEDEPPPMDGAGDTPQNATTARCTCATDDKGPDTGEECPVHYMPF